MQETEESILRYRSFIGSGFKGSKYFPSADVKELKLHQSATGGEQRGRQPVTSVDKAIDRNKSYFISFLETEFQNIRIKVDQAH